MGMSLRGIEATPVDVPDGRFFDGLGMLPHFYAFWIPFLLFDTLLCVLALVHGYRDYKEGDHNIAALKYFDQQRLSEILVRDSIIYFVAIGAVYLASLVIWILDQNPLLEAPIGFSIAISSALGSRLILNLCEADANQTFEYSLDNKSSPPIVNELGQ